MLAYLVRHAESLTNAQLSESMNPPLSHLGLCQTEALVRGLSGIQFTAIYSSPFRRCLDTAEPIARSRSLPIRVRPELHECYYLPAGTRIDTELEPMSEILATRPIASLCEDWFGPIVLPAVDETREQLFARMLSFGDYLKQRWGDTDEAVLVVSHGSPIAKLIDSWLSDVPGPSYRFAIDNATVSVLRYRAGVGTLVCLNERSHLRDLPPPEVANYDERGAIKPRMPTLR